MVSILVNLDFDHDFERLRTKILELQNKFKILDDQGLMEILVRMPSTLDPQKLHFGQTRMFVWPKQQGETNDDTMRILQYYASERRHYEINWGMPDKKNKNQSEGFLN